jgi:hypothetical protein
MGCSGRDVDITTRGVEAKLLNADLVKMAAKLGLASPPKSQAVPAKSFSAWFRIHESEGVAVH